MNHEPPPGYDDESVIPRKHLKFLLGQFEDELIRIERIVKEHLPSGPTPVHMEQNFPRIRATAEELGSDYSTLVEKLIDEYRMFREHPDESKLDQLFSDVRSLQLMLAA